jgi:hypothetical protein
MENVVSHLGQICKRCEEFDFSSIFDPDTDIPPSVGRPIKPNLDSCTSEMETASCPLCRLFAAVRFPRNPPVFWSKGQYHLRALSSLKLHSITQTRARVSLRPSIALSVESGNAVKKDNSGAYMMAYGLIAQVASPATLNCLGPYDYFGSEVNPDSVNFDAVRLWLSQCARQHTSTCGSRQVTRVPSLRVIDCDTLRVVLWDDVLPGHDYFALSYVWNKPDPCITQTDSVMFRAQLFESLLPHVMVDAIEVVKKVRPQGSRYLWVDRYCIDQCDAEEKHSQIKAMDLIYEGAFATIIAASANGSETGLPGVGPTSRRVQPSAIANGIRLVSTLPHVSTILKDTAWAKRGWTYQEAIISRRCLIFTDLQVYFICRKSTHSEAVNKHSTLTAVGDELPSALFKPRVRTGIEKQSRLSEFQDHVLQYSQRTLTYDKDGLDAFRGILARSPYRTYWGIPIFGIPEDPETGFSRGLGWKGGLKRREALPSWSWTGWTGGIQYYLNYSGRAYYDVNFWFELQSGTLVKLRDLYETTTETIIQEQSYFLHVWANIVKIRFQRAFYSPQRSGDFTQGLLCFTHLNEICPTCNSSDYTVRTSHRGRGTSLYHRSGRLDDMFDQSWDALLLVRSPEGSVEHVNLLIVEWHGDTAERVGLTDAPFGSIDSLPKTQRIVRLK